MRNSLWILLVLGVLMGLLPAMVSADQTDPITDANVTISFSIDDGGSADSHDKNGWLVAGSGATSTILVAYSGTTTGPTPDIHFVRFTSLKKDMYGDVTVKEVTGAPYQTVFSASENRAGNAPIRVEINYTLNGVGYDYNKTVYQPIDHTTPKKTRSFAFESEVTIGEVMNITLVMEDAYGNAVTSLYEDAIKATPENVTFETTRYAGSGFYDGDKYGGESVAVPVNAEGTVVATFKVGTEGGPKYLIHIVPPAVVYDKWLTITALADARPYAIRVSVVPNVGTPPSIPADGESKFHLTYTLSDRYGNPSGNQSIHFTSKPIGDEFTWRTNSDGQVKFTFGPFDDVATFNISATAVANTSVTINQEIYFASISPDDMILTASPQSMPSADVPNATGADIYAKVMDECGNGVSGQNVSFWIVGVSDSETTPEIPSLNALSAVTNGDGIATVHFTPGAFETNAPTSESCTVEAKWGSKWKSIVLEWKNYPYLRVETEVDRETVEVGKPVNLTVRLIGDGYALSPKPIDVMLCADRSGSMSTRTNDSAPTRLDSLKYAVKVFNGKMTGEDRVGISSFGGDVFGGNSKVDLSFTNDMDKVNSTIEKLNPNGFTPMRKGLYLAIKEFNGKPPNDAVQVVILLSDGEYNWWGDPLARGTGYLNSPDIFTEIDSPYRNSTQFPVNKDSETYSIISELTNVEEQNLSVYAKNNDVIIYSIALGDGLKSIGNETLKILAKNTGGKYYYAPTGDDLAGIYTSIAGELKTAAGVNTKMDLDMSSIELNNVSQLNNRSDPILEYEYVVGASTLVKSWMGLEGSSNNIYNLTLNQKTEWDTTRCLSFDSTKIGTIQLNQTWQAKFRLIPMKPGNINIFGNGSSISFNDGATLNLPKTYITAEPDLNATGINFTSLRAYDLMCKEYEENKTCPMIKTDLTMEWCLNYSGNNTVTQCLYYQKVDDGFWILFDRFDKPGPLSRAPDPSFTKQLYVADFPPGEYKLRVRAMADDAADSVVETPAILIGKGVRNYILLE